MVEGRRGKQIAVRVDGELVTRLEDAARRLGRPGVNVTKSDAIRAAMHAGLDVLERGGPPAAA